MALRYVIDLISSPLGLRNTFRLQQDGEWKRIEPTQRITLADGDFSTGDLDEIRSHILEDEVIEIDGDSYHVHPRVRSLGDQNVLSHQFWVARDTPPPLPSQEQLLQAISDTPVQEGMISLCLNVHGDFVVLSVPPMPFGNPSIAVRNESVFADEYGDVSSIDSQYIKRTYRDALQEWCNHIRTGRVLLYDDTGTTRALTDIMSEIEEMRGNWSPQF